MFKKKIEINIRQERSDAFDAGHKVGYEVGMKEAKIQHDIMVEKRALDLYTNQNWLVNPNQVFQVSKTNIPYLGMEPVSKGQAKSLQMQAKTILSFELWGILTTLIRQKAIDLAVKESKEWEHVLPGKMMVHNIALMESLVKYISEVDIDKIPEGVGKIDGKVL